MGLGWLDRGSSWKPEPLELDAVLLVGGSATASSVRWSKTWAKRIAEMFRKNDWTLVYCGMGTGLAGDVAKALLAKGGKVVAVVVSGKEPPDVPAAASREVVADFHERQRKLFDLGDAALVLPGGLGTLSEMAELGAWRSAGLYTNNLAVFDPDGWFDDLYKFLSSAERAKVLTGSLSNALPRVSSLAEAKRTLTSPE